MKDNIQGERNLYKSSHDCSLNEERKFYFFFLQEQITRTRHVSARVCFVRLRLKLTDQVVPAGAELGALVLHNAEFVFLVRKLTHSVLE